MGIQKKLWHCTQEEANTEAEREHDAADMAAPEQGMVTPPQPAPKDSNAESGPEAEMSFTDLIDDSDEEVQGHGQSLVKALASGQVLVDPEDVEVRLLALLHICAWMLLAQAGNGPI